MNVFGTKFDYQGRIDKLKKLMAERGIDAVLVHLWPNQYYFSGHYQHFPWYPVEVGSSSEPPMIIFREKDKAPVFLTTWLTGNDMKEEIWTEDVRMIDKEPFGKMAWPDYVAEVLKEKGVPADGTIGIEEHVCVLSTFQKLQTALPKAKFTGVDELFWQLRTVKAADEIALIKESIQVARAGLEAGKEAAKVGVLETEIFKAAKIEATRRGALLFVETMCESGKRTAHSRAWPASWKKVEENDLVLIDIGVIYKGYGSDLTRTWVVGKATTALNKINDDLRRAWETALNVIKPGVTMREVQNTGDNVLAKMGYLTREIAMPTKNTGQAVVNIHGIGLGPMHDPPHDRNIPLESGVTLALSGKARYPDFTIRQEDNVVVTPGGCELMSEGLTWKL
ncbi:M24 family metallopeptidase [Chloroflexota bacterium]